jgi:hypothetical protein
LAQDRQQRQAYGSVDPHLFGDIVHLGIGGYEPKLFLYEFVVHGAPPLIRGKYYTSLRPKSSSREGPQPADEGSIGRPGIDGVGERSPVLDAVNSNVDARRTRELVQAGLSVCPRAVADLWMTPTY